MVGALLCWKLLCFKSIASVWSSTSWDRQSAGKWEAAGNQPNVVCTRLPPVNMHHGKLTYTYTSVQCILLNIDYLNGITNFSLDVHSTCSISTLIVVAPVNLDVFLKLHLGKRKHWAFNVYDIFQVSVVEMRSWTPVCTLKPESKLGMLMCMKMWQVRVMTLPYICPEVCLGKKIT